jgi:hypothetical protein
MADPGLLFVGLTPASLMLVGEQGTIGSNEIGAAMKNGVSCLAIGIGLLSETLFAFGHAPSSTVVAQLPTSVRPSGVLTTTTLAPVAVPPSGVLPTLERRAVTTLPFKSVPKMQTTKKEQVSQDEPPCRAFAARRPAPDDADHDRSGHTSGRHHSGAAWPRRDGL